MIEFTQPIWSALTVQISDEDNL